MKSKDELPIFISPLGLTLLVIIENLLTDLL